MKLRFTHFPLARHALAAAVLSLSLAGSVHAGLTLQMNVIHNSNGGEVYTFAPNLYLNGNGGDSTPITYDQIYSPPHVGMSLLRELASMHSTALARTLTQVHGQAIPGYLGLVRLQGKDSILTWDQLRLLISFCLIMGIIPERLLM